MNNYTHKYDNLDEMNKFLEKHNRSQLSLEKRDNLNRPIREIGSITNNPPKQKAPGPDSFVGKCYQIF